MANKIGIYTLRIMAPDFREHNYDEKEFDEFNQGIINHIGDALSDAENTVNEWLPDGYYCKIESS